MRPRNGSDAPPASELACNRRHTLQKHVNEFDVVIVGYGPTGQLLALLLGRLGHSVAVVERWANLHPLPRAVHFDHEIGRIFQAAGVSEDVFKIVESIQTYEWRNAQREPLLILDWSGVGPSGWPVSNMFSQPELECVLDQHIKELPSIKVFQGCNVTQVDVSEDSACVHYEELDAHGGTSATGGERRKITARWVVGADGANSLVRRSLGIEMHDLGFAFDWLVVDVKPRTARNWNPYCWQLCDPARPTTIVPSGPGRRRWEFMLLPGETATDMNRAEVAWKLLESWDIRPENADLERHAVYTFRGRWAKSWRHGSALLAGDAAHLMPPFAGQGMCSGMRDSVALAWRLDGILRGTLPDSALDSYGSERTGHVQEMIGVSVELGKVICIADPVAAAQRDKEMIGAQSNPGYAPPPPPQPHLGAGIWQKNSPGAGQLSIQAEVAQEGVSALLDDLVGWGFVLLVRHHETLHAISSNAQRVLTDRQIKVVHFGDDGFVDTHGQYGQWLDELKAVAVLIRPDFYVYASAGDSAELEAMLASFHEALSVTG